MNRTEPLEGIGSIKLKIGLLVALSILAAVVVLQVGRGAGVPAWVTLPVTLAAALGVTQWLARGMTAPLRQMTAAAGRMATGDYSVRVGATSTDEVGQLASAFNTMAADLGEADEQRRQLLATVSHELRTPLAAQQALLENLVDGVVTPDDAALGTVLAQSERLSALVRDLLDVSRVGEGAATLDLGHVDVAALLTRGAAEARAGAGAAPGSRSVTIETSVEPEGLTVVGDQGRLAQVVANLLDNAVRHSPAGGTVRVRAGRGDDAGTWFLEVSDEGPGFPPGKGEQLFARFGVGDDSSGGTGLGLAIARWVCELHGGTIGVVERSATSPGTGATVRAVLPVRPTTPAHPSPASATDLPHQARQIRSKAATSLTPGPTPPTAARAEAPATAPAGAPTTAIVPTPSVVEALFGPFWPERDVSLRRSTIALWGAVAVGALAALLLPFRQHGVGTFVVLVSAGALVLTLAVRRREPWTLVSAALCLALGSLVVLRGAEWLWVLALLACWVLVTTALTGATRLGPMVASGLSWVLAGLRGLPLLRRTVAAASRHQTLWPVVRTAAISLVALVVFLGLFASADAVVGSWVSSLLPEVNIADSVVLRAFVWFLVSGVVLAGCYLALNPARVERVGLPPARRVARDWEWAVPLGVVIFTFLVFLAAQASAMWGGHRYVQGTTGMTYAESVHQGFGQLTLATALTLVTVAVVARKASVDTPRQRLLVRGMLGALCALTLVVVASALYRMWVYQEAYGYTVLRVLVDAFELWLGLLVVMVLVAGVRLRGRWVPRAALISGAVMLLVIGLANPEAWVAQRNIDRYESTGRLDLAYLSSLGPDAIPVIQAGLPEELADCATGWRPDPELTEDALSWNLGRSRALDAAPWASDPGTRGLGPGCPAEVGGQGQEPPP